MYIYRYIIDNYVILFVYYNYCVDEYEYFKLVGCFF